MSTNTPKRIHNPIPPEFANVSILRLITVFVACISLLGTGYTTWLVYSMSNRISGYEVSKQFEMVSKKAGPINFTLLEKVLNVDSEKQRLTFIPPTHDPFYNRPVTTTVSSIPTVSSTISVAVSSSTTSL